MPEAGARHRVVVLTGPFAWHRGTCATLIESGVNVVGICVADQRRGGLPLRYVKRSLNRRGWTATGGQVAGRLLYRALNRRRDRAHLRRIFPEDRIAGILNGWEGAWHRTESYSAPETMEWIRSMNPDVLLVHSGYWVGKKVRELCSSGVVLGGHPGITPYYRGSHAAFWALYNGESEMIGGTVFWLDSGVDTGDIAAQDRIEVEEGDTYFSLGWRAMKRVAELQAELLLEYDRGIPVPRSPHEMIPQGSEYPVPTLAQYVRYRKRQRLAR
jgi:hypothetical protein